MNRFDMAVLVAGFFFSCSLSLAIVLAIMGTTTR